jgi:hypothetical protein
VEDRTEPLSQPASRSGLDRSEVEIGTTKPNQPLAPSKEGALFFVLPPRAKRVGVAEFLVNFTSLLRRMPQSCAGRTAGRPGIISLSL